MTLPPAGWHPDPSRPARLRYWDGDAWTGWVHRDGAVVAEPLPDRALGILRFPPRVVWTFSLGIVGITIAVSIVWLLATVVIDSTALLLTITFPVQHALTYLLVRGLSRRHGTGRVVEDLRWRVERRDVWPGVGTAVLALIAGVVTVNLARSLLGFPVEEPDQFGSLDETAAARAVIAVAAVVAAPLFEELLFRGVALHALLRWGRAWAVLGSSLLFGLTHLSPALELSQNVLLMVSTTTTGSLLAWVTLRADRLGPAMVAHAAFNLLAVTLLFTNAA